MNRGGLKVLLALAIGLPLLFLLLARVLPDPEEEAEPYRPDMVEVLVEVRDVQTGEPVPSAFVQVGRVVDDIFRTEDSAETGSLPAAIEVRRALMTDPRGRLRVSADGYRPDERELNRALAKWRPGSLPLRISLVPE